MAGPMDVPNPSSRVLDLRLDDGRRRGPAVPRGPAKSENGCCVEQVSCLLVMARDEPSAYSLRLRLAARLAGTTDAWLLGQRHLVRLSAHNRQLGNDAWRTGLRSRARARHSRPSDASGGPVACG